MRIEEFDAEKKWWKKRKETEQAWRVTIDEIKSRGFNLDIKNPNAPEFTHDDPDELLARYAEARAAAAEVRDQLKKALADALEGRG